MLRFLVVSTLAATLLLGAAKKNIGASKGENEDLRLTVTLYMDPADVKELLGDDLGGHYMVADVKVEPKFGKEVTVRRDDFLLRTYKDGEKATPFVPSQIAGKGVIVVSEVTDNSGVGSPGWTGATGPVIRGGNIGSAASAGNGSDADRSRAAAKVETKDKANPLEQLLEKRMLPFKKTAEPISGLLYFPMEKQKMKDMEMSYGGRENRITLTFKPTEPRP